MKLVGTILRLVEKQQNGENIGQILAKVVNSFVSLGLDKQDMSKQSLDVYEEYFEIPFVTAAEKYYKTESEAVLTVPSLDKAFFMIHLYPIVFKYKYIDSKYVKDGGNLDGWKVLLPKTNGTGRLGEILSTPIIAPPMTGHTQTFISFGNFKGNKLSLGNRSKMKKIKTK